MLEIFVLFRIGKHIASIAKKKNRSPVGYVLILVFGWFALAFGFGIVGLAIAMAADGNPAAGGNDDGALLYVLPGYLFGAACAVGLAYLIVGMVPPLDRRRVGEFYDDEYPNDDDDRPRRRHNHDDDYDRPRSRRQDEDDDYDRPRRRDDY